MHGVNDNKTVIEYKDSSGVYVIKPDVYDLNMLRNEVIDKVKKAGVTDKNGQPVFKNAIHPVVVWSKRIMKSYYGMCYKRDTIDGTGFCIRINKIMSSPQAPRETLKFLIYHELLHANGYWHHDVLFRDTEWRYPDSDEHLSFLDSLNQRFKIVDNDLPMYDKEPEIIKTKAIAEKEIYKRYIAFTSQCSYQIIDKEKSNSGDFIYVALVPENLEKYFMLFAYNDGRFAKVSLHSYRFDSHRSVFKNAYSTHAPMVWLRLFESDKELAVFSSINKIVVFNTNLINPVESSTSMGVIVQRPKNNSTVVKVELLDIANLTDVDYYRCANIPAIGVFKK